MSFKSLYHKIWEYDSKHNSIKSKIATDDVVSIFDIQYGKDKKNNVFDLNFPKNKENEKLPTIFVVHGGGYISGSKNDTDNYSRLLSQKGYCVINIEYTRADGPEKKYFNDQLAEIYDLFDYIKSNKEIEKHIDYNNIFLAGDSAGAHLISMVANIQTNPALRNFDILKTDLNIKGLIFVSPMFGPYKLGLPVQKQFESVVYGDKISEDTKFNNYPFNNISKCFPSSIMISFKNDFVVMNHKSLFLKIAKKYNLSVQNINVSSGYKMFHDALIKYPECYSKCMDIISNFIESRMNNNLKNTIVTKKVIEQKYNKTMLQEEFN